MPRVEWVEPALTWNGNGRALSSMRQPRLTCFESDDFLSEFIAALGTPGPDANPEAYFARHLIDADSEPRLYQPLHGCYYLVTGSLVCCRQVGLPDKAVDQANDEKVSFVVRRCVMAEDAEDDMVEQGWDASASPPQWRTVKPMPECVLSGEERFPLHPLKVCMQSRPGVEQFQQVHRCTSERTIYHGYLPTGNREKYRAADASVGKPEDYITRIQEQSKQDAEDNSSLSVEDFRYSQFDSRVLSPWKDLVERSGKSDEQRIQTMSLYLVLDFADYLSKALPDVWDAVKTGDKAKIDSSNTQQRNLYDKLNDKEFITIKKAENGISLREAMAEQQDNLSLVEGEGEEPDVAYDASDIKTGDNGNNSIPEVFDTLATMMKDALDEEQSNYQMSDEMKDVLQNMVEPAPGDGAAVSAEHYFIRLVYHDSSNSLPVVSEPSQRFTLAPFFDSEAPARQIRLELPSIKMQDLRKFKRGVGMQMSPELRSLMERINEKMLKGGGLQDGPQWSLGLICTFSLQIIFLVAFIVMFIFLILLNVVFWWLPFLKICLPIPRKSS